MIKNYKEKIDDRYYIVIEDGIEYCVFSPPNSDSEWWAKNFFDNIKDKHHRIDGPAIICGAYKAWWFNAKINWR